MMLKEFKILWSNDERLLPIFKLTDEERKKFGLLIDKLFERKDMRETKGLCFRLKCEFVSTDMTALMCDPKLWFGKKFTEHMRFFNIDEAITWREKLCEKPLPEENKERWRNEIEFIKLIKNFKEQEGIKFVMSLFDEKHHKNICEHMKTRLNELNKKRGL